MPMPAFAPVERDEGCGGVRGVAIIIRCDCVEVDEEVRNVVGREEDRSMVNLPFVA